MIVTLAGLPPTGLGPHLVPIAAAGPLRAARLHGPS
jgi:hypothetical protein